MIRPRLLWNNRCKSICRAKRALRAFFILRQEYSPSAVRPFKIDNAGFKGSTSQKDNKPLIIGPSKDILFCNKRTVPLLHRKGEMR